MEYAHIKEGLRIYKRSKRVQKNGVHRYSGDARVICEQIIEDCWNGTYLQTSTRYGHFCEFYMRDFGWAVKSLLDLGYAQRVRKTLEYVLGVFATDRLTTTINPDGRCVDIFEYSPDSVVYLLFCLKVTNATDLVQRYNEFLNREVKNCFSRCFDTQTSLMRADAHFGSIKDSTLRYSSTYDNTMLAWLSDTLNALGMKNPFNTYDIRRAMLEKLWNTDKGYWYDDISRIDAVTGDSNTFPYWTGVFTEKAMIESSVRNIRQAGLDDPFPLKYSNERIGKESLWRKLTVPEYQTHSIKTHMGGLYLHVVKNVDEMLFEEYYKRYAALIEKHGTYLENFTSSGEPICSRFYYSDEGNIWAANFLTLKG